MAGINFTSPSAASNDKQLNGGLNSTAGPFGVQSNEATEIQNIDFDKFGSIIKRGGYATLNTGNISGGAQIDGLHWYEYNASGSYASFAVATAGTNFYAMNDLDGQWDDTTGAVTITAGNHCDFENFLNEVYVTNGTNPPWKWAGTSTASIMSVPTGLTTAKYVKQFSNYLFIANVTVSGVTYPSRIYWSGIKDTSSWDAADWIEIAKDDGQEITGIKVLADRLVIYKRRNIYNLFFTGDADIPFILPGGGKSNSAVGCIAPFSIQEVENGHVFLAADGLYYYDGMNSYKLSHRITSTLFGSTNQTGFNTTNFNKSVSCVYKAKNRYMISFCSSGETQANRVIVWDYFNNAFSIYVGMSPSSMATFFVSSFEERPYFGDYGGFVYRMDFGVDDYKANTANAINSYYITNWRSFEDLCDQKGVPQIYLYHQVSDATLGLGYSYDFATGSTDNVTGMQFNQTFDLNTGGYEYNASDALYGTATYAGEGGMVIRRDLDGRGRVVRFKFANAELSKSFRIDGLGTMAHLETNV